MPTATLSKPTKPEDFKLPSALNLRNESCVEFGAEVADEKSGKKTREFSMLLYSGAPVDIGFGYRMIVDLEGMKIPASRLPIQANHKWDQQVGFGKPTIEDGKLNVKGKMIVGFDASQQILTGIDGGFHYQASMGFSIQKWRFISREDEPEKVNGREFSGPGYIVTKSKLSEGSFVPAGADGDTSTALLSENGEVVLFDGDPEMSSELKDKGKDPIAEFAAAHGEQVEKWRAEGHAKGGAEVTARFEALSAKFADRPAFVVEQFKKGNDVAKAQAEFADVLQLELKAANEKLAEATKAKPDSGGHKGVEFSAAEKTEGTPAPTAQKRNFKDEAEAIFQSKGGVYKDVQFASAAGLAWHLEDEAKKEAQKKAA